MKQLIDVRVDWATSWANAPRFEALVTSEPEHTVMGFDPGWEHKAPMYRKLDGDIVHFLYYTAPGQGFGGRAFTIMVGEERRVLKGPWSGNSTGYNQVWPEDPCLELNYVEDQESWDRGYTFCAGAVQLASLLSWWRVHRPEWGLALVKTNYGVWIQPTLQGKIKTDPAFPLRKEDSYWGEEEKVLYRLDSPIDDKHRLDDSIKFLKNVCQFFQTYTEE